MSLLIPMGHRSGKLTALGRDGALHAVDMASTRRRDRRFKRVMVRQTNPRTWVTTCGAKVIGLSSAECVTEERVPTGHHIALAWPPPARNDRGPRCAECWADGRHRPDASWSRLLPDPEES